MTGLLRRHGRSRQLLGPLLILLLLAACTGSDRPSIAARATVQTFFAAMQVDNVPLVDDNLANSAAPDFRDHVRSATESAQSNQQARLAITLVRVDPPAIDGNTARVQVVFADGGADTVSLAREGLRWKVVTTGRLS